MNKKSILLVALVSLACSITNANITNVVAYGDYYNVDCYNYDWNGSGNILTMQSDQYGAGSISGQIQTDTETDPNVLLNK